MSALDSGPEYDPQISPYSKQFKQFERKALTDPDLEYMLGQLKSHMKDAVVIDIGAGEADDMAELARDVHAKQYIGVDIRPRKNPGIDGATYVNDDIETYLTKGIPDGRHVVICNGFDTEVAKSTDFHSLAAILSSQMNKTDVMFGFESPTLVDELLSRTNSEGEKIFQKVYEYPGVNFFIIRKRTDAI
jgi:hypothetical protein